MTFLKILINRALMGMGYSINRIDKNAPHESRWISLAQMVAIQESEVKFNEALFLMELVRDIHSEGPIIEIGTLFGTSTQVLGYAKKAATPLITVDNYCWNPLGLTPEEHQWYTGRILGVMNIPGLKVVTADKAEFYATYKDVAPSLAFLDAGHSYEDTAKDIQFAKRVEAKIICGHDYHPEQYPGVVQAVAEAGGPRRVVGSLWVL